MSQTFLRGPLIKLVAPGEMKSSGSGDQAAGRKSEATRLACCSHVKSICAYIHGIRSAMAKSTILEIQMYS